MSESRKSEKGKSGCDEDEASTRDARDEDIAVHARGIVRDGVSSQDRESDIANLPLVRLVGLLFGAVFTLVGTLGVRSGFERLGLPSAPAKILRSERIGMGDHMSSAIVAEFKVGPDLYHRGQVRMGRDNMPGDVEDFPVGSTAAVSYDPARMDRCVLVPGVSGGSLVFLATGAAFLGLAAFAHARMRASGQSGAKVST